MEFTELMLSESSAMVARAAPKRVRVSAAGMFDDGFVPDFAVLFPAVGGGGLSARAAYLVSVGAELRADLFRETVLSTMQEGLVDAWLLGLPSPVLRWLSSLSAADAAGWLARFHVTFAEIGARLAGGCVPFPRSVAEQVALHLVLLSAEAWWDMVVDDTAGDELFDVLSGTSTAPPMLDELDVVRDMLFAGCDVVALFDSSASSGVDAWFWFEHLDAGNPPPVAGAPRRGVSELVELGVDPDSGTVAAAVTCWLDVVTAGGTVVEVSAAGVGVFTVTVDVALVCEFEVLVEHVAGDLWCVFGVRWTADPLLGAVGFLVYDRADIERFLSRCLPAM